MQTDLGVIITNRDRPGPLSVCLQSIAAQTGRPAWVAIADLGSGPSNAAALEELADRFSISYLQIAHPGIWNQGLAFNTALSHMPPVGHVIQLDADFILHPYMLEFTQRALRLVDAMCCVPSYLDVREVPEGYDGSAEAFGCLLSKAYGGNRLSRGGYVVMPRDWMVANGAYDEAYQGWGFEDADLWWRAEQRLRTYEEFSGSLAIHQSHERQPNVGRQDGYPNWERYQQRVSGLGLEVNPSGFGRASVSRHVVRQGICPTPAIARRRGGSVGAPRTRQGERLRPAHADTIRCKAASGGADKESIVLTPETVYDLLQTGPQSTSSISVLIVLADGTEHAMSASIESLALQTIVPAQVTFLGRAGEAARWSSQYASRFERCGSIATRDGEVTSDAGVFEAIDRMESLRFRFVMRSDWIVNPTILETLCSLGGAAYTVSGPVFAIPPVGAEMSLLDSTPWEAWGAIAHLESKELGRWQFYASATLGGSSILPSLMLGGDKTRPGRVASTTEPSVSCRRYEIEDLVLCITSPRKANLPEVYG